MPTYTFNITGDNGDAGEILVTTAATATNDTGLGSGYDVTSVSGTFDGKTISGEYGVGGVVGQDDNIGNWDNTLFLNNGGLGGSQYGVDDNGIAFQTTDGETYALYTSNLAAQFNVEYLGDDYTVTLNSSNAPC